MRSLKIVLSIVALLIAVAGIAHTTGVVHVSNESATMLLSLGGLLGILGVSPIKLSLTTARVLAGVSAFIMATGPVQAAGHMTWMPVLLWHIIAIVGTFMGIAGTSALQGGMTLLKKLGKPAETNPPAPPPAA